MLHNVFGLKGVAEHTCIQGLVEYSAASTKIPIFPVSDTLSFSKTLPGWLEGAYSHQREQEDIVYFATNIRFPAPVIVQEDLISMLNVDNGAQQY
jgi:hypothetical protein